MKSKTGRFALVALSFGMMILFQNFTYDRGLDVKSEIFNKKSGAITMKKNVTQPSEENRLQGLARQASGYADFVGVENVAGMTDAEILSRVSDSMFTSLEVMKMENSRDERLGGVETVARSLERDARLQRMVIAAVRENARQLR